ncbi:MAG TPA: hypothetical protein VHR47_09575 [Bacillota bacterium]|nr:hypothetical protein [Bacillota bacterium]
MDIRYDSALFAPVPDPGLLEGLVMYSLDELGIDREGLSLFRRTFEHHRDILVQAFDNRDAEQIDRLTKQLLQYVPKYSHLDTLNTDINLNPQEWLAYGQEHSGLDRNAPGATH